MADISFDECSVHYIGHTKIKIGRPYQKLENGLIKQTKKIYLNLHPLKQGKEHFKKFFSEDCKTIALLFLNRSYNVFFSYVSGIAINTMEREIRSVIKIKKHKDGEKDQKVSFLFFSKVLTILDPELVEYES